MQSTLIMSETASSNEKTVHLEAPNEGGESSGKGFEGPLRDDDDSSGDQGAAPVSDIFKSPSIIAATIPLNEESKQPVAVKGKPDKTIEGLVDLFREFLEAAPDPPTSNSQRNRVGRRRLFGLGQALPPEISSDNRYDHEQKYSRDLFGEEVADKARVWFTCLDEAETSDREEVEGWKERADVLLVFAGLFSGVITTFVVQASPSLQKDNTEVSASLLFEIAQLLRAQSSGTPISHVPNSTLTATSPFTPSTNAFLVNGLLFTSLAITLSTALFAVLTKQWLYHYLSPIDGTAHQRVRVRQLRYKGFKLWKVGAIVDLLPILLYLAVGVFLTGIIILLFPLDIRVAWTIVAIAGITYGLYLISTILPILYPGCPYTTSLTTYVGVLLFFLRTMVCRIGKTSEIVFQAGRRKINFEAQHAVRRLLHYTRGLFRYAFIFIFKLAGVMCRYFRKFRKTIVLFAEDLPKFTEWREESIKKAVQDGILLDYEALDWLYGISPNRSLHRIIARCVAVHPIIGGRFGYSRCKDLLQTLEVSKTNLVDLRYGLCLDLLVGEKKHWRLLQSIPDAEESQLEKAEYYGYFLIVRNVLHRDYTQIVKDGINADLKLPLVMWRIVFRSVLDNVTVVGLILTYGLSSLFDWESDPIRGSIPNAAVVGFDSKELGWWKFYILSRYFFGDTEPEYSLDNTLETRYLLLTAIYRNLTSDRPVIADKEQRQETLSNLFINFSNWLDSEPRVSFKQYFAFFIDICGANAFWSESMTNDSRYQAALSLSLIWQSMDTDVPFTECDDLSPIYQWCSRDLISDLLGCTTPIFTLLFMPQNRLHLWTLLSRDPDAVSHLTNCFRNMRNHYDPIFEREYMYPNLIDLLKLVNPKVPLFIILYNPSVLVQLWKFLLFAVLDTKRFFLVVKSKLDKEKLNDLYVAMMGEKEQSSEFSYIHQALEKSVREFGRIIECAAATEEHVREMLVPDANERGLRFIIANWTNQAFRSLRLKTRSENRDWDVDVELS